jgi:hypothetical protein
MLHRMFVAAALGAVAVSSVRAQQIFHDDFNRPDGTVIGNGWIEVNGDLVLQGNRGKGNLFMANDTWMAQASFAQPYTSAKARIQFEAPVGEIAGSVGVALGLTPSTWSATTVRLQDNDLDGLFDRIFFEAAINAGAWYTGGVPVKYDLPVQLAAGQLTAWVQDGGNTAVVRVEDAAGHLIGIYSASGIAGSPFAPTGTHVGVWVRSRPYFDEFWAIEHRALDAYPATISLASGGTQTLDVSLGSAQGGKLYLVLGSASGTTPGISVGAVLVPLVSDGYLLYTLTNPNQFPYSASLGTLHSTGHARARVALPALSDPTLAGLSLHHAAVAIDLAGLVVTAATNAAALTLVP